MIIASPVKKVDINQYGDYVVLNELGHGSNGVVYKVKRTHDNKIFAMKKVNKNIESRNSIINEIKIMKKLDHPNLIKYYEMIETPDYYCMIMEYASHGNL